MGKKSDLLLSAVPALHPHTARCRNLRGRRGQQRAQLFHYSSAFFAVLLNISLNKFEFTLQVPKDNKISVSVCMRGTKVLRLFHSHLEALERHDSPPG